MLAELPHAPVFWHLDTYATRTDAEAARGPRGTVVQSLAKEWLLSIEAAGWRPRGGERVAEIGPLPVRADARYAAQYMEAIFTPGMTAPAHRHSGPEAWYTLTGETCLETPEGKLIGRAGGSHVIVPGRAAHAPDGDGQRDAPGARPDPPRFDPATDDAGARLEAQGTVHAFVTRRRVQRHA